MSNINNQSAPLDRLEATRQTIKIKTEEIKATKIFGVWGDEFPFFVEELFEVLNSDIEQNILKSNLAVRGMAIDNLNQQLEDLLSLFDSVVNTICKNSAVHELMSYMLRDLELQNTIRYVICMGNSLATLPLIDAMKDIFYGELFYKNTLDYLEEYERDHTDFSIVFIPPLILQKKIYWSALAHEVGHIIINLHKLVTTYNPKVELSKDDRVETDEERDYYHCCEYICDFIGNAYFGSVFYEALYEYAYVDNVFLDGTHPTWDARLYFLQKILPTINSSKSRVTTKPPQDFHCISNIDKIIDLTKTKVFDKQSKYYAQNDTTSNEAKENLKNKLPYVGSPRTLLNSYWDNQQEILDKIKENDLETKAILESKLAPIIEDSVRISNMERTFRIMANG